MKSVRGHWTDVSNSEAHFEKLFREYSGAVHRFVLRRAPAAVAEDAVGDTFVIAWRRLADIPPDAELSWLLRATAHRRLPPDVPAVSHAARCLPSADRRTHRHRPEHAVAVWVQLASRPLPDCVDYPAPAGS